MQTSVNQACMKELKKYLQKNQKSDDRNSQLCVIYTNDKR